MRALRTVLLIALAGASFSFSAPAGASGDVRYFGYFAARLTPSGGDHLAEVADRSNLNWVQISDYDRYRPEVLDGCRAAGCIVSTGHEFFTGCDKAGSTTCRLHPDYRQRWMRLANAVASRQDRVGAFYLLDEPQWRGAKPADLARAAAAIKATYPSVPVMMVEAGPTVTDSWQVPANVDWVGFDWYCRPFSDIQAKLAILERRTSAAQRLFLMPEAAPLSECGGRPGHRTDAEIAQLQWQYYNLAAAHPRVIGLLAFGFWTSGHDSSDLPRTVAAHRQIAARIIPPPPPAAAPPPIQPPAATAPTVARVRFVQRRARLRRSGVVAVAIGCPAAAACSGRVTVTARLHGKRRRIARKRFAVPAGQRRSVRLHVTRRARVLRLARRRSGLRVTATARTAAGTTTRRIVLHA